MIELLAAHAAIAITNARLYEHSRELSIVAERNRLALELHDAVSQKLFSLVLDRRGRRHAARPRPGSRARAGARLQELAREALDELRSLILELRPPDLERDGLAGALRKHVEVLAACSTREIELEIERRRCPPTPTARPARCCASRRRRCRTRCATPTPTTSRCA